MHISLTRLLSAMLTFQSVTINGGFHSAMLYILFLGMFDSPLDLSVRLICSLLHLTGIYSPLYFGTMYIYSELIFLLMKYYSFVNGIHWYITSDQQSPKSPIVLSAISLLYLTYVIFGLMQWASINILTTPSTWWLKESLILGASKSFAKMVC